MRRAPAVFLALLLTLTAAAGAVLAFGARPPAGVQRRAAEFQRLTGGLGFGPALDLAKSEFSFDPRLSPACSYDVGPVPGAVFLCPYHASAVVDYAPLSAEGPDAHVP